MKIRNGYVSNSSSSSFIIKTKEQLEQFNNSHFSSYKLYTIKEIKAVIEDYVSKCLSITEQENKQYISDLYKNQSLPDYIISMLEYFELQVIKSCFYDKDISDDMILTEPIDRDEWYQYSNIELEVFVGDL